MHGDGFGCLHTEDISGHKIEGLPFLRKNTRRCTYAPQDAAVSSKGSPFMGEEVEITTKSPSRSTPLCPSFPLPLCPFPASRPLFLFRRMLSGLFVCLFPGIECRLSSSCSRVFSPAGFFVLFPAVFRGFLSSIPRISAPVYIPPDAIRHPLLSVHLPHPCTSP